MSAALDLANAFQPLLHIGELRMVQPAESHHVFGAGFLFIGSLMTVEGLSGRGWHRSRARTLMFPAVLILLGWGMIAVTAVEPQARLVHFSMGLPMIAGGWAEARSRLDGFPRPDADVLIVTRPPARRCPDRHRPRPRQRRDRGFPPERHHDHDRGRPRRPRGSCPRGRRTEALPNRPARDA